MSETNRQIAHNFFNALSASAVPDSLLADDLSVWTTTSGGGSSRAKYQGGIRLLGSLFPEGLQYHVDSLTAEDDPIVAEAHSTGVLTNGEIFSNNYAFILRIRDGRITSIAEHFNPEPVREQLLPLLQAAMAKAGA